MTEKLLIALAVLLIGFASGWMVNGWRHDSKQSKEQAAAIAAMKEQAAKLAVFNKGTAAQEAAALDNIRKLNQEIQRIRDEIQAVDVGECRLTPAADGVRKRSYDQAVPARKAGGVVE